MASLSGLFDVQGGLTLTICLQILAQVLSALMHLHRLGILHRDLRAANVLLAAMDPITVMVTDFGVSRILSRFAGCAGTVGTAGLAGVSAGTVSTASVRSYGFSPMLRFRLENLSVSDPWCLRAESSRGVSLGPSPVERTGGLRGQRRWKCPSNSGIRSVSEQADVNASAFVPSQASARLCSCGFFLPGCVSTNVGIWSEA
jgi:serine/threonine protein kinase